MSPSKLPSSVTPTSVHYSGFCFQSTHRSCILVRRGHNNRHHFRGNLIFSKFHFFKLCVALGVELWATFPTVCLLDFNDLLSEKQVIQKHFRKATLEAGAYFPLKWLLKEKANYVTPPRCSYAFVKQPKQPQRVSQWLL